jgi:hypothetical protein
MQKACTVGLTQCMLSAIASWPQAVLHLLQTPRRPLVQNSKYNPCCVLCPVGLPAGCQAYLQTGHQHGKQKEAKRVDFNPPRVSS